MPPLFVVLLVLAIGCILAYQRTSYEIYRFLTGAFAFICFIIGFALAPWQAQVLIMFLLLGWERFYTLTNAGSEN